MRSLITLPAAILFQIAIATGNAAATTPSPPETECDRLAGTAADSDHIHEGVVGLENVDADKAIPACEEAVELYPETRRLMFQLGRAYDTGEKYEMAATWYRKSADLGSPSAQYNLGYLYHVGQGVAQSHEEAGAWYRKSADQGDADALCNLGILYQHGAGVEQDFQMAFSLFQKATDKGDAVGQYNVGAYYRDGLGVAQDYTQAALWLQKSAEQGDVDALYSLATLYRDGTGVEQNEAVALKWFQKAVEQGDEAAQEIIDAMSKAE